MTEIDFYVLDNVSPQGRAIIACRLVEKAFELGHRIYLHAADAASATALDAELWRFRPGAFLPHELLDGANDAPILLGHGEPPTDERYLLVNLAPEVPAFFSRFERVAEIVNEEPAVREAGRERFRFYRDRGYSLRTHKLKGPQ